MAGCTLRRPSAPTDQQGSGKHVAAYGHAADRCGSGRGDTRGTRSRRPHGPAASSRGASSPVHMCALHACACAHGYAGRNSFRRQRPSSPRAGNSGICSSALVHVHCDVQSESWLDPVPSARTVGPRSGQVAWGAFRSTARQPGPRVLTLRPASPPDTTSCAGPQPFGALLCTPKPFAFILESRGCHKGPS